MSKNATSKKETPPPFVELPTPPFKYQRTDSPSQSVSFGSKDNPSEAERKQLRRALQNFG